MTTDIFPRWISILILAACVMVGSATPAAAQNAETGAVAGVVVDGETGDPLPGANVSLEGTTTGTATDLNGRYKIAGLAPGSYDVVFSFIGFQQTTVTGVDVEAGQATEVDITLNPETEQLDEVIITAEAARDSEAGLLKRRQKAAAVSDAISAEAMSQAGASTAAAAMGKVTGATVIEGKYVNIRGLGGRYVNTQLNGADLPSSDPEENSVPLDLFPSGLLDNIQTSKTFTPDKSAAFTGGSVDLSTKSFPTELTISLSSSFNYTENVGFGDMLSIRGTRETPPAGSEVSAGDFAPVMTPTLSSAPIEQSYSASFGNQYDVGGIPLGIVAGGTFSQSASAREAGRVAQWELTGNVADTPTLDNQFNFQDRAGERKKLYSGLLSVSAKPSLNQEVGVNVMYNRSDAESARFQVGAYPQSLQDGEFLRDRRLRTSTRTLATVQGRGEHLLSSLGDVRIEWNSAYTVTEQDEPDFRLFTDAIDSTDSPANVGFPRGIGASEPARLYRNMEEASWSNDVSVAVPIAQRATVKLGGSYIFKDRTYREDRFLYRALDYDGNPETFFQTAPLRNATDDSRSYDGEQTVAAVFGMIDMRVPAATNLRFIGGLRAELTEQSVQTLTDVDGAIDEWTLVPSANLIYSVTDEMNIRAAFSRTLARPTFQEFAPVPTYDFVRAQVVDGNENLELTTVRNADLRWEWFTRPGEVLAVSGYYKDFTNPIEQTIEPDAVNREVTFVNAPSAEVFGLELEARRRLGFISERFQYVQVGGNLTLVHSSVEIPQEEFEAIQNRNPNASDTRSLVGQSPFILNLDVGYENPESQTNLAVFYNIFGDRLDTVERAGTPNQYERSRPTLDVTFSQGFRFLGMPGLKMKASAKNLTDADFRVSHEYRGTEYTSFRYDIGRSFSLGFAYDL